MRISFLWPWVVFTAFFCVQLEASPVHAPERAGRPALYVFAVGTELFTDPGIPRAEGADRDIQALLEVFSKQQERVFGEVHTGSVVGEEASGARLQQAIAAFFMPAERGDLSILYLGLPCVEDLETSRHYLLPADTDLQDIRGSAVEQSLLIEALQRQVHLQANLIVLADVLSGNTSGGGAQGVLADSGSFIWSEPAPFERLGLELPLGWAQYSAGRRGGGGAAPSHLEAGPGGDLDREEDAAISSLFVAALVKTLEGRAADQDGDGLLSYQELHGSVVGYVRAQTGGAQLPELSGSPPEELVFWAPGGRELCNYVDDDGDGEIDNGYDLDGDGYNSSALCPSRFGIDCDDGDPAIHPEQPDGWSWRMIDDDCDGLLDEDVPDNDGNGIPDAWDFHTRRLKRARWVTLAAGVALLGGAAATYSSLQGLTPEVTGEYDIEPAVGRYKTLSYLTIGMGSAGLISLGGTGAVSLSRMRFQVRYVAPRSAASGGMGR